MMGNDILSLNEAQKPDRGVVNIFHLAFVMVLLKMEVSSSFFNLDLWPCESSLPWAGQQLSFGSCVPPAPFLTTENLLCTCSNWVLSDKHLASPENCSIKSQPQLWGSTIIGSRREGLLSQFPGGESFLPGPFSGLNYDPSPDFSSQHALLWLQALTPPCTLSLTPQVRPG